MIVRLNGLNLLRRALSAISLDDSVIITKSCAQVGTCILKVLSIVDIILPWQRIRHHKQTSKNDKLGLRIAVEGGGCSGFKYTYSIEDIDIIAEDDKFVAFFHLM